MSPEGVSVFTGPQQSDDRPDLTKARFIQFGHQQNIKDFRMQHTIGHFANYGKLSAEATTGN